MQRKYTRQRNISARVGNLSHTTRSNTHTADQDCRRRCRRRRGRRRIEHRTSFTRAKWHTHTNTHNIHWHYCDDAARFCRAAAAAAQIRKQSPTICNVLIAWFAQELTAFPPSPHPSLYVNRGACSQLNDKQTFKKKTEQHNSKQQKKNNYINTLHTGSGAVEFMIHLTETVVFCVGACCV